jgi:hypothetical protein
MLGNSDLYSDKVNFVRDLYHTLDRTLAEAVKEYAKEPLEFEPDTRWLCSNPGIATLGRIIDVVSGE